MILGHQKQREFLKKAVQIGKIPHAFLFSGPEELGKKTLAVEFAKFLINNEKCEIHPDFILIEPKSAKGETQISQIRELIWKLSLYPYSAPYKVAVVDKAHQMTREAQNCFLKTLEEPRGKSVLILISEQPEMLVPTILSRVQKIRFSPVKKDEIENYLIEQGASKDKAEYLSSLSLGRPGRAINLFSDKKKLENQEKLISQIEKIRKEDFSFRFQSAKNLAEEKPKEILNVWLNYFRGLFLSCLKGDNSIKERGYSLSKLKNIISLIQSTNYLISNTNINSKLALEILLMEI